jgi:hypothetical protein
MLTAEHFRLNRHTVSFQMRFLFCSRQVADSLMIIASGHVEVWKRQIEYHSEFVLLHHCSSFPMLVVHVSAICIAVKFDGVVQFCIAA